jgi:hypothetical protein
MQQRADRVRDYPPLVAVSVITSIPHGLNY